MADDVTTDTTTPTTPPATPAASSVPVEAAAPAEAPVPIEQATEQDTEKYAGVGSVVAGTVGLVGGGEAAAHILTPGKDAVKKQLREATKELDKADSKLKEAENKLLAKGKKDPETGITTNAKAHAKFTAAETAHKDAQDAHSIATAKAWEKEIAALDETSKKSAATLKQLDGQLKYIKDLPPSIARDKAVAIMDKHLTDFKKVVSGLKPKANIATFDKKLATFNKNFVTALSKDPAVVAFIEKHGDEMGNAGYTHLAGAEKELADKVAATTEVKTTAKNLEEAAKKLEKDGKPWLGKAETGLKAEKEALTVAEKGLKNAKAIEAIVVRKGFANGALRPIDLIKHGSTGTKVAILASAVALCVAGFFSFRTTAPKKSDSFVDQVNERRAATPAAGQGQGA